MPFRERAWMPVAGFFSARSPAFLWLTSFACLGAFSALKYFSGPEITFAVFYLLPTLFATWFISLAAGIVLALASALCVLLLNLAPQHPYSHPGIPYWNAAMAFTLYLVLALILDQLKAQYERERQLSRQDSLTLCLNRRAFTEILGDEASRARRYLHPLSLTYVDIDDFKHVNDAFGHRFGDAVLSAVGGALKNSVREVDSVARIGGDEFVLLLPETDSLAAEFVLRKLQSNLQAATVAVGCPLTFSIGAVTFAAPAEPPDTLLDHADRAMYAAKQAGKDRVFQRVI